MSLSENSKAAAALAIIHRSDSYVCVTPFAGPVLPEGKNIAAGPSGSAGGRSSPGTFSDSRFSKLICSASSVLWDMMPRGSS